MEFQNDPPQKSRKTVRIENIRGILIPSLKNINKKKKKSKKKLVRITKKRADIPTTVLVGTHFI